MTSLKLVGLFFLLLLLAGCVSYQSKSDRVMAEAEKGSAVYIYRPDSFSNVVVSPDVLIDGKEHFLIGNGKYTFVYLAPGQYKIKLNLDENYSGVFERLLDIKPGQDYFLRVDTTMRFVQGQPYVRTFNLNEVTTEVGVSGVQECRYMKPEMPSKYLLKKGRPGEESRFTTDKTSDPFSRNK